MEKKIQINVRLTADEIEQVKAYAANEHRSVTNFIEMLIIRYGEQHRDISDQPRRGVCAFIFSAIFIPKIMNLRSNIA